MRIFLFAVLLGVASAVFAEEQAVELAPGVPGKLEIPDGQTPHAAVLLLHGWNGSMDEVGDLYANLAAELSRRGIASLRFDFSGEGERVGYVVTSTLQSRLRESAAGHALLRARFEQLPLGVVGFSLGGLTAMELARQQPDWFDAMVLWSAASNLTLLGDPTTEQAAQAAVRDGRATYTSWAEVTITREFVLSFVGVDASRGLESFAGPVLAIRGTEDFLPANDPEWLRKSPGEDDLFVLIDGADHIFDVLNTPRPPHGERVIDLTADWFAAELQRD